jgi:hypothetical protein
MSRCRYIGSRSSLVQALTAEDQLWHSALQPHFRRGIFEEQRTLADILAQGGERPVAGLAHDGAFGHAGSRRGSGEAARSEWPA